MSKFYPLRSLRRLLRRKTDPLRLLARKAPPGLRLRSLVHVGAHLGQERHAYEAMGYRNMLWIEGSERVHAQLAESLAAHVAERRAAGLTDLHHQTLRALLASRDGEELALREFSNDGMSSSIFSATDTLRERWPALRETGREERVLTRTLDGLLAELGFGPVDVLVVDVQGAELLVLQGARSTLGQVKAVVSEVSTRPFYNGGVLFPQLQAFLHESGFEAMSTPRRHGDMLFVQPQRAGFGP
jgi:FkbM family methyltransferase